MKEQLIQEVQRQMLPYLNNAQLKQLQGVLEGVLSGVESVSYTHLDTPILLNGTICCWRKFEKSEIIGVTNALLRCV